jgi:AcrR family transcriptional regulator
MPYPSQVSRDVIIEKARELIEQEGVDQLSLHHLAAALGIKAPSLYRYVANKTELLQAVNTLTVQQLTGELRAAVDQSAGESSRDRLLAMANAYRNFAHTHPATYQLTYGNTSAELRPDDAILPGLALPLQAVFAELTGEANALVAMGGAWALIHGFIMLELNQQFRRLDDTAAAFVRAVDAYLAGWTP